MDEYKVILAIIYKTGGSVYYGPLDNMDDYRYSRDHLPLFVGSDMITDVKCIPLYPVADMPHVD